MTPFIQMVIGLTLVSASCWAGDMVSLKGEKDKINYSVGYQVGKDFASQGIELNPEAFVQGLRDGRNKSGPLLSHQQMSTILVDLKKKVAPDQSIEKLPSDAEYRLASEAFLKENAKSPGVKTLGNGIQYKVLRAGSDHKPTVGESVRVHYRITRVDGREIGSTYGSKAPRTFKVSKAFPGLQQVLLLMGEGAQWQVVFPAATVAGGREALEGKGAIIYELELLSILKGK